MAVAKPTSNADPAMPRMAMASRISTRVSPDSDQRERSSVLHPAGAPHRKYPQKNASPQPWPFIVTVKLSEEPEVGTGADSMRVPVLFSC